MALLRRKTTVRDYRRMVDDVLAPLFGHLALRAVSAELVDSYRAHLVAEGRLAPRTINKYLLVLHAIFRRAQRHFGLTSNPVAGLDRQPVRPSGDFRVLSPEEVEALARAARAGAHRSPPSAPLSEEIQAAHRAQDAQDAAIFVVVLRGAASRGAARTALTRCRRTLAVQVFPLSDVKAYMGHADIATTMLYVHHVPQHDAAAKLSAAVTQAARSGGLGVDPARLTDEGAH